MTDDMKAFALRLKESAGAAGIYSPRELARLLGVQAQTVNQWYSGKSKPNGKNLANLVTLLRVQQEWLIHGTTGNASEGFDDPAVDFADAKVILMGMSKLLSGRSCDLSTKDADKIGRIIKKSVDNADQAFQALLKMYQSKGASESE
ncbi:MAG: helix-turn-helix domain-containing protein [Gammaproteobacteria bacterium]|nr:helix-turn-helix domain-containing protein [Gammaproteobacteria bacterium]